MVQITHVLASLGPWHFQVGVRIRSPEGGNLRGRSCWWRLQAQFCRFRPRAGIVLWPPFPGTASGTEQRGRAARAQMGARAQGIWRGSLEINQGWGTHQTLPALTPEINSNKGLESHLQRVTFESSRSSEMLLPPWRYLPRRVTSCPTPSPALGLSQEVSSWASRVPLLQPKKHKQFSSKGHSMYSAAPYYLFQPFGYDIPQPHVTTLSSLPSNIQLALVLICRNRCQSHVFLPVFSAGLWNFCWVIIQSVL